MPRQVDTNFSLSHSACNPTPSMHHYDKINNYITDFEKLFHNIDIVDNVRAGAWKKVILPKIYGWCRPTHNPREKTREKTTRRKTLEKPTSFVPQDSSDIHNMHKLIQQDSVSLGYTEQMHRSISCCDKISVLTHEAYKNMRLKQAHELLHRTAVEILRKLLYSITKCGRDLVKLIWY